MNTATTNNKFYCLLIITAIIWGAQPVLVKLTVQEITPVTITSVRYFLLSATLFIIMFAKGETVFLPSKNCYIPLMFMGFSGILINNVTQFSGLQYSTVTNATLISCTTPAMTACLAAIFLRERLIPLQWLGIITSLSGATYLISHGSLATIINISFNFGDILFFISQLGWAIYSLISIRVMREMTVLATTAWAGLIGAIFTSIYGLFTGTLFYTTISTTALLSMVYIIWGGGVLCMLFWNISVKATGASRAAIFLNIMPIIGIICGVILLNEEIRFQEVFGAIAILSGVYLTTQCTTVMHYITAHTKHSG